MIERFSGEEGKRLLLEIVKKQIIVENDEAIATLLIDCSNIEEFQNGEVLIEYNHYSNDLFLIISGEVSIFINGNEVVRRKAGVHIGEVALMDASVPRSATALAFNCTVVLRITEKNFNTIANKFPVIWRRLAIESSRRLVYRNVFIKPKNDKPRLFIGSSAERLAVAKDMEIGFEYAPIEVVVWPSAFEMSLTNIENIERQLAIADFAAIVLGNDDMVIARGKKQIAPRDNAVFELGLFMGKLGRQRTFIVVPHDFNIKLPSDLMGVMPLQYYADKHGRPDKVDIVCSKILRRVSKLGSK
ncbi:MAG: nucleotide-binding protein [Geminicoccaceae bacterium]|nr:nucleotide-binding protein [Geminicoccaceae bacterium]